MGVLTVFTCIALRATPVHPFGGSLRRFNPPCRGGHCSRFANPSQWDYTPTLGLGFCWECSGWSAFASPLAISRQGSLATPVSSAHLTLAGDTFIGWFGLALAGVASIEGMVEWSMLDGSVQKHPVAYFVMLLWFVFPSS